MSTNAPRRFWKEAAVVELSSGGYGIVLDGRPLKVPSRSHLTIRERRLAEAVAAEWNAVGETMDPEAMPLTQLANTAQDRVAPMRDQFVEELLKFVDTDMLCYRAPQPAELVRRQRAGWQPILDWAAERFGCQWCVTERLMPEAQPDEVHEALRREVERLDDIALTALQVVAPASGSLVAGLALVEGRINVQQAYEIAFLDELFQADNWGEDPEAVRRRARILHDLERADAFLRLARPAV